MGGARRWATGLLAGALLLAVLAPWYLVHSRPSLAVYLLHPSVFIVQGLPYAVAAALWLPRWRWGGDIACLVAAALVGVLSLVLYVPVLWAPGQWGGDMIALGFLAMSGATTALVLVASALIAVALWLQRKRSPARATD